jgi:glucose/arabinose dehydrogenase
VRRRRLVGLAAAATAVLAGGGVALGTAVDAGGGPSPSRAAADRPCDRAYVEVLAAPAPTESGRSLVRVGAVEQPTALVFLDREAGDGLLASRTGEVRRVVDGEIADEVVLDLSDDTVDEGDGGLLGLAYDPAGEWLYVYRTTVEQDEELIAYPVGSAGVPDPGSGRLVMAVDHGPSEQHHGGGIAFGPDGHLYLGLGDGGGLGDPEGNAQDPATVLGKVIRIAPTPDAEQPYVVPDDNPFVGRAGWRPEIWALGVRNPFRLGFDDRTGDLWVADVGQACWEELNRLPAGRGGLNLGWDVREGTHRFEGGQATGGRTEEPEVSYAHRAGWCAIVLGYVAADGSVLHTDYCRGRLMALVPATPTAAPRLVDTGHRVDRPVAVVRGPGDQPWLLSLEGGVYRVEE